MHRRVALVAGALAVAGSAGALSACGGTEDRAGAATDRRSVAVEPLPTRNPRARAVEPVAGESAEYAGLPTGEPDAVPEDAAGAAPLPKLPKRGPSDDDDISRAQVLKNGIALPPIEAPEPVRRIFEAGNQIARAPYLWGGGHGRWLDKGYDCSGSISFALAAAGLLRGPLDSGRLMGWGKPGKGKWVTIYTNPGHVYMVVAGVRFDTSARRSSGSRWHDELRPAGGYTVRHPPGL